MNWYLGSIQDAIATSKRRKAYFIVYVEGSDELSVTMTKVLDSPDVSSKFEKNNFVAIKLAKDSEGHKQFEAFYKLVPVPSLFFIDQNGSPVEIVVSDKSEEIVLNKVNNAIKKCVPNVEIKPSTSATSMPLIDQPSTSASSLSSDFITAEANASSTVVEPSTSASSSSSTLKLAEESVEEDKPAVNSTGGNMEDKSKNLKEINKQEPLKTTENPAPQTTPNPANKASIEERVEKAKILIEKKKEEKTLEEMKNEKKAELERRRVGQELLLAKREQQDRELRQLKEEREREKKEEALARQRILDQIAQDRAERAERQNIISKPPQENSNANAAEDKVVEPPTPPAPATGANANIARLQFKLPSGETKSHNFTRDTTLSQVREFIDSNIVRPFGSNYQLATTFPRREFTARDNNRNLRELQLIPSAVILIIPTSGSLAARPSFGWTQMIIDMFWDLTQPVISLSRYVCNLIFGRRNTTSTAPVTGQSAANSNPSSLSTRTGGLPTTGAGAAAAAFNTNVAQRLGGTSTIKKRGNIYSLREHRDDDEDNNTWNGNSTQQM